MCQVTVYDLFWWGVHPLFPVMGHPNLSLVKGDVTDWDKFQAVVADHDIIIHLAAIVGYPACAKDPEKAVEINQTSVEKLAGWIKPGQKLVSSTRLAH